MSDSNSYADRLNELMRIQNEAMPAIIKLLECLKSVMDQLRKRDDGTAEPPSSQPSSG